MRRVRLALFIVATLATVQLLSAQMVHAVTRRERIEEGRRQLAGSGSAFVRQLDDVSQRVADNVQVLALATHLGFGCQCAGSVFDNTVSKYAIARGEPDCPSQKIARFLVSRG